MPGFRQVNRRITAPLRMIGAEVGRVMSDLRKQAPGARMVGEFAVKMGLSEIGKKLSPKKPDNE